jgi:hypothetical protein
MRNDTSVTGGRAADKSALSAARRVCLSLTAGSPDLSGALPFPLHQSLTCCSLLPSSLLQSSISFLSCRAESWFLDFIVGIAMSTGSPTPQGPFRTVCALCGLCARVFARCLDGSRRVTEIAEENKPNCGRHSPENSEEPMMAASRLLT